MGLTESDKNDVHRYISLMMTMARMKVVVVRVTSIKAQARASETLNL